MSQVWILTPSVKFGKKWTITTPTGEKIHFGDKNYFDYTQHHDRARQQNYIRRHQAVGTEQWDNPYTAGFWSRWLLWERPFLDEAINNIRKKFKINVKYSTPYNSDI
jgi:hypothetical protein